MCPLSYDQQSHYLFHLPVEINFIKKNLQDMKLMDGQIADRFIMLLGAFVNWEINLWGKFCMECRNG